MSYQISNKGLDMIKAFEAFRSKPYLDSVNVPTIGYGTTFYPDGKKVTMQDYPITEEKATELLKWFIDTKCKLALSKITSQINQNQVDSVCSFVYNIGEGGFISSTLLKKINLTTPCSEIQTEFMKWVKAGGKVLQGLVNRRTKEAANYCS